MNVIGEDATAVFNMLSGYSEPKSWNRLVVAPIWMKDRFLKLINREAEHGTEGDSGFYCGKDEFTLRSARSLQLCIEASACGVQIYLFGTRNLLPEGGSARSKREYPCADPL